MTCIDHYGALADVCFGDIHLPPYSEDKVGISSWVVRTPFFNELFKQAVAEKYITMHILDAKTLNESQKTMLYPKQRRAQAIINMDRLIGKETVKYDFELEKPQLKDYISEILCQIQRYIGKHPSLCWVIDYLYNKSVNNKKK